MQGVPCKDNCTCHYDISKRANVFACSGMNYTTLPNTVPRLTNRLSLRNTSIKRLCGIYEYLEKNASNITDLNLYSGRIKIICDETLAILLKDGNIKSLNLAHNKINHVPTMFKKAIGS